MPGVGAGPLPHPAAPPGYAVGGRAGREGSATSPEWPGQRGALATPHGAGTDTHITTLTQRRDFLTANKARRAPMPGFVLLVRRRDDGDPSIRLGITVTKKIGNAVVRNRMKRRFRALGRELLPTGGVPGSDHVLIGRSHGVERPFDLLRAELVKALAKARRA